MNLRAGFYTEICSSFCYWDLQISQYFEKYRLIIGINMNIVYRGAPKCLRAIIGGLPIIDQLPIIGRFLIDDF